MANQVASATLIALASVTATAKERVSVSSPIVGLATIVANTKERETETAALLGLATCSFFATISHNLIPGPPLAPPPVVTPLRVLPTPKLQQSMSIPTRRNG